MSKLDNVFAAMAAERPEDTTCDYWIDEDMRVIEIPERGVVIGVENDKDVNHIRFKMNRMWRGNDMSKYDLRINYKNAKGGLNYYDVKNKYIEGDVLAFEWIVAADATAYKGDVYFIVVGLIITEGVIDYAFHTTLGKAQCLEGLAVTTKADIPEIRDFMTTLKSEVKQYAKPFVDSCAESADTAKSDAERSSAAANVAKSAAENAKRYSDNVQQTVKDTLMDYTGGYYRSYVLIIPAKDWAELPGPIGGCDYACDVILEDCNTSLVPMVCRSPECDDTAVTYMASVVQTLEGRVRFFATQIPTTDISVLLYLFAKGTGSIIQANDEEVNQMFDEIFNET